MNGECDLERFSQELVTVGVAFYDKTVGSAVVVAYWEALKDYPLDQVVAGVIVFFLQIDTLPQKNSSRDKHLQNRLSETPCAFGAD